MCCCASRTRMLRMMASRHVYSPRCLATTSHWLRPVVLLAPAATALAGQRWLAMENLSPLDLAALPHSILSAIALAARALGRSSLAWAVTAAVEGRIDFRARMAPGTWRIGHRVGLTASVNLIGRCGRIMHKKLSLTVGIRINGNQSISCRRTHEQSAAG